MCRIIYHSVDQVLVSSGSQFAQAVHHTVRDGALTRHDRGEGNRNANQGDWLPNEPKEEANFSGRSRYATDANACRRLACGHRVGRGSPQLRSYFAGSVSALR